MIAQLLPDCAETVEADAGDWTAEVLPEEAELVARAVEKRRREFAAGRVCARRALARLGWPGFPLLAGRDREPIWPPGIVGSITHCSGYCAATVARQVELRSVGIDAEVNAPLPDGVSRLVCTGREMRQAAALPGESWPTLIFSAKESVYKAWYPLARRWLGYLDAEVTIDALNGCFGVRILAAPADATELPLDRFEGRFAMTSQHVYTAVTVVTDGSGPPRSRAREA